MILACVQLSEGVLSETPNQVAEFSERIGRLFQTSAADFMCSRCLNPTRHRPVIFEDVLGDILEIPLEWIKSWN